MGKVIRFVDHARSSAFTTKSSAVTRLSVAALKAPAKSLDNHTLPRRSREMVVRSQETPVARMREAIDSSSSPSIAMNSDNCMGGNVHTMHIKVNLHCAKGAIGPVETTVHNTHMGRNKLKAQPEQHFKLSAKTYFKEYRIAAGLSQPEAASKMGYADHSTLSKIEAGKVEYNKSFLEAAARVYQTSIWHLLYCPPNTPIGDAIEIWTKSIKSA